jgi:hypothetical protein
VHGEAITPPPSRESEFVGMGSHRIIMEATSQVDRSASYYDQGSSDLAQETALTEQRLEAVRFPLLGVLVVGGDGDDITKKNVSSIRQKASRMLHFCFFSSAPATYQIRIQDGHCSGGATSPGQILCGAQTLDLPELDGSAL